MPAVRAPRRTAFAVLACTGTFLAHVAIWSVTGGATPATAAVRSAHGYLRPVGLLLLASCLVLCGVALRTMRRLETMLRTARGAIRTAGKKARLHYTLPAPSLEPARIRWPLIGA